MDQHQKDFLIHMLNMSAHVLILAIDAMERKPEDMERRAKCFDTIRTTAEDLRKLATSDTVGLA